jgi:hypothetical protein
VYARANRVPRMIHELQTAFDEIKSRLQLALNHSSDGHKGRS